MHIRQILLRIATLLLLCVSLLPRPAAADQFGPDYYCSSLAGHCIFRDFYSYWQRHGGLPVFGYPTTWVRAERALSSDQRYLTQWLERTRFEYHPHNAAPYDVLLGRLGVDLLLARGIDWATFPKAAPGAPHYYPQTGHAIAPEFWGYWSSHGLDLGDAGASERESLALFGYPISSARIETNSSGHTVLTQWFERARFELHPNGAGGTMVLLGLLGNELRELRPDEPQQEMIALVRDGDLSVAISDQGELNFREQQLTNGPDVLGFAWSPDSRQIAYHTNSQVFVIPAEGGQPRAIGTLGQISDDAGVELTWSHDSQRIAYTNGGELAIVGASGEGVLATIRDAAGPISTPAWSPDGQLIAYAVRSAQGYQVVTTSPDGRRRTTIGPGRHPGWSNDGQRLTFTRPDAASSTEDLYLSRRDGSDVTRLTTGIIATTAIWSPIGMHIAFEGSYPSENGRLRIFVVQFTDPQLNTRTTDAIERHPSWGSRGRLVVEVQQGGQHSVGISSSYLNDLRTLNITPSSTPLMPAWAR